MFFCYGLLLTTVCSVKSELLLWESPGRLTAGAASYNARQVVKEATDCKVLLHEPWQNKLAFSFFYVKTYDFWMSLSGHELVAQEKESKDGEKSCKDSVLNFPPTEHTQQGRRQIQDANLRCSAHSFLIFCSLKEVWADALCVDERSGANHLVKACDIR